MRRAGRGALGRKGEQAGVSMRGGVRAVASRWRAIRRDALGRGAGGSEHAGRAGAGRTGRIARYSARGSDPATQGPSFGQK